MPKRQPTEQFSYRVRKSVDCIVTVEATSQSEADEKVKDAGAWVDEMDVECTDWELRGRA
jgi:hypothetical protein